jgi:hypothetical protein
VSASQGHLVPPELRELVGLLAELAELLPSAVTLAGWEQRHEVQSRRGAVLASRLQILADELNSEVSKKYPAHAAEWLAECCERSVNAVRAELAKPLGYEPKAAAAGQSAEKREASQ